jgi:hypothetical protein
MRLGFLVFCIAFLQMGAFAQDKGKLPPSPQKMPDRDAAIIVDDIAPGKSRLFNWHSATLEGKVNCESKATLSVLHGGKTPPTIIKLTNKNKPLKLKLETGPNILVVTYGGTTPQNLNNVYFHVHDREMQFEITAHPKKGMNDTLIIKRH